MNTSTHIASAFLLTLATVLALAGGQYLSEAHAEPGVSAVDTNVLVMATPVDVAAVDETAKVISDTSTLDVRTPEAPVTITRFEFEPEVLLVALPPAADVCVAPAMMSLADTEG